MTLSTFPIPGIGGPGLARHGTDADGGSVGPPGPAPASQGWGLVSDFGGVGSGNETSVIAAAEASPYEYINLQGLTVSTNTDVDLLHKKYFNGTLIASEFGDLPPTQRVKLQWPAADEHLQRRRTKAPFVDWADRSLLWLGTSIPHQGVGNDSYPDLFAQALNATVANWAWSGSRARWDFTDPPDDINTVKCLSMTEDDRQWGLATYGPTSAYDDSFDVVNKASQMTADYRIRRQFSTQAFDAVFLDHAHNDRRIAPGVLTPIPFPIVSIAKGATTIVTLTGPGLVAVGNSVVLDLVGITKLDNAAARVISVLGNTFTLNIDSLAFAGTFTSGNVILYDRATVYGAYQFLIHYILWCAALYDWPTPQIVMSGAPSEYTTGSFDPPVWSISTLLKDIAEKWSLCFFDIGYEYAVTARDQAVYFEDLTHPLTTASRQALANHWVEWASGGSHKPLNPDRFLPSSTNTDFTNQHEALYSKFIGGFGTPSQVLGLSTTVLTENFTSGLGAYTITGTPPVIEAAPWGVGNAIKCVTSAAQTSSYLSRNVALDNGWSAEFDFWLPVVTGLAPAGPSRIIGLLQIRTPAAYYVIQFLPRENSIQLQLQYFKTPNVDLVAVPTRVVLLSALTKYHLRVEAMRATATVPGGVLMYLDGELIAGPVETLDAGQVDPDSFRYGSMGSNTGRDFTVYTSNLVLTKSPVLDYSTRASGLMDTGSATATIVNGVITALVPHPGSAAPYVLAHSAVPATVTGTGVLVEADLAAVTIPGGVMGANGFIEIDSTWSYTNSSNSKQLRVRFDGTQFNSVPVTTTASTRILTRIMNRNNVSSQIGGQPITVLGPGSNAAALPTGTINTAADVLLRLTGAVTILAEVVTLEAYTVRVGYIA